MNTNLSQTFNFDDEDRLTNWTSAGTSSLNGSQSWNLSLTGSWSSNTIDGVAENRNYNDAYEILDVNGSPLFYDAKGNLTDNKDGSEYKYDFDNQMFQSTNAATIDTDYTYDALGRRVSLESQGVTTLFVYCGYQVKTEYESTGGAFVETKSYVHGSYIDDVVAMIDTNNTYYYHCNRQFSVGALTDSLGNLRERYAYNAYGDMKVIYEDLSIDNPYCFTGRRLDTVSGLYYFRARYYDAVLGQFISRDPLGYVDGMGLYNGYYVPLGMDPLGLIIKIIGGSKEDKKLVESQLELIASMDPNIENMIETLRKSKYMHYIDLRSPHLPNQNKTLGDDPDDEKNGKGTGSQTVYDPNATETKKRKEKVPPEVGLGHELLHAYDKDQGSLKRDLNPETGVPVSEERAVSLENIIRDAIYGGKKTTYDNKEIQERVIKCPKP